MILGEFHYRNQDDEKAMEIWDQFRKTKLTNQTTYRLLFHSYVRFGQTNAMESLAQEGRERFDEPHLFAIDLANYYQSRQTYDRSIREYLTLIRYQKQYLRYTTDRILIMSDDTTSHTLIDSTLRMESENCRFHVFTTCYTIQHCSHGPPYRDAKYDGVSSGRKRLQRWAQPTPALRATCSLYT